MKIHRMAAAGLAALLGACATTDDPREGGFIGGVQGLSSGAYQQRVSEREDNLAKLRAMQADLEQDSAALQAQKGKRQQLLAEEKRKLASLDSEVEALQRKLTAMGQESATSDDRVRDLRDRVADLKARLGKQTRDIDRLEGGGSAADALEGQGNGDGNDSRRRQLEAQRTALQREYDELLNLTLMLAQ